jgi:molybdate transport system ATP-binding protein
MNRTNRLDLRFDLARRNFTLDVDTSFPIKGITGIFGPSGSGKSTVLRCIAGLERSAKGRLMLDGICLQDADHFEPPHRRGIALIDQGIHLFTHLNVRRNLLYGYKRAPIERQRIKFDDVVENLDLAPILDRDVVTLSGGEARRVAIGRALLAGPNLLLLDEPCAGLDAQRKREVLPFLRRVEREFAIPMIYVTHDLSELVYLSSMMATMNGGRIEACGTPAIVQTTLDPDAHATTLGAIVRVEVSRYDAALGAVSLAFANDRVATIPSTHTKFGTSVYLQILARDVGLALEADSEQSALAVLEGEIAAISTQAMTHVSISISTANGYLLALVDRLTCNRLNLKIGLNVHASIRHAAMLI